MNRDKLLTSFSFLCLNKPSKNRRIFAPILPVTRTTLPLIIDLSFCRYIRAYSSLNGTATTTSLLGLPRTSHPIASMLHLLALSLAHPKGTTHRNQQSRRDSYGYPLVYSTKSRISYGTFTSITLEIH